MHDDDHNDMTLTMIMTNENSKFRSMGLAIIIPQNQIRPPPLARFPKRERLGTVYLIVSKLRSPICTVVRKSDAL